MSFENFKIIIDKMPFLKRIGLYNWGEPFLNIQIFDIIKYAEMKKIAVTIHSNFSLKRDENFFKSIINSGLSNLSISLDGASQKTYEKYRIGGNYDLVIENLKKLVSAKKELNSLKPDITWQYIVNKYSEHEIENTKLIAEKLGIELLMHKIGLSEDLPDSNFTDSIEENKKNWLPQNVEYVKKYYTDKAVFPIYDYPCHYLFSFIVINFDGNVFPCCYISDIKYSFGNVLNESFDEIWNNNLFLYSRKLFYYTIFKPKKENSICITCENYRKRH